MITLFASWTRLNNIVGIKKNLMGAEIPGFGLQTGSLA
jgi:hypothetical protein